MELVPTMSGGVSEACRLRRGEGYGACDDAGPARNPDNKRCDEIAGAESKKYKA